MLEMIVDKNVVYVLMGAAAAAGVVSKCVVNVSLKRLVRGACNMSKSNHPLMRLVRAKFEHACMVSEKVENVGVFVDKYLYEYRVLGVKLHSWRRLEKAAAGMCLVLGALGACAGYSVNGMNDEVLKIGAAGAGLGILVYLFHLITDENYRMDAAKNYMVDYLENVCLHRYEKVNQKELKVMTTDAGNIGPETGKAADGYLAEEKKEQGEEPPAMPKPYPVPDVSEPVRGMNVAEEVRSMSRAEDNAEPEKDPELVRALRIARETATAVSEAADAAEPDKKRTSRKESKDVLIRQILEEFMA